MEFPLLGKYKAVLIAAAFVSSAGAGWVANGWRLGKQLKAQEGAYWQARARRGEDYTNTLAKAATAATDRILESQAILEQAKGVKAKALTKVRNTAPKSPGFECLDKPLPEDYLENFRQ